MPTFVCPTCQRSVTVSRLQDAPHRPFCSPRCKLVDLGRWLDGSYAVSEPATPEEIDQEIQRLERLAGDAPPPD